MGQTDNQMSINLLPLCLLIAAMGGGTSALGIPTIYGNAEGAVCVFPFVYANITYWNCTTVNHTKPWCATTNNYDQDGNWGECPPGVPKTHVICTDKSMKITLEKSEDLDLHADNLQLNDPYCTLSSNATHVFASIPLTDCGTKIEDDGENIIFRNDLVSINGSRGIDNSSYNVMIKFVCKYPKTSGLVSVELGKEKPSLTFEEKSIGMFSYQIEFFWSPNFLQLMDPDTSPLEFNLGDMIYMQIASETPIPNTELFVESCIAAPSSQPNHPVSYTIIKNGCNEDKSVQNYPSHVSKVRLGFKAFHFIGRYEKVFITCSVILCEGGVSDSKCSQGCIPKSEHPINKREAHNQTSKYYITHGPLRLRRELVCTGDQTIVILKHAVVVVLGLLTAVAMVCGVLILYKVKESKVKYEPMAFSQFEKAGFQ